MSLSSIYRPNENVSQPSLNSVMAKLAVMDPRQLQAFAAAHEHDPIMLSAAQAVKNKHDEFMQQKLAMQNGAPPPVNQQVVQQMAPQPAPQQMPPQSMPGPQGPQMPPQGQQAQLPENVGIGQLPAQNIQNMAGGGIVAFGDGGEVPGYADQGLVYAPYGIGAAEKQQLTPAQFKEAQRLREMGLFDLLKEKFGPAWQALTTPPATTKTTQQTLQSGTDLGGPGSSPANMGAPAAPQIAAGPQTQNPPTLGPVPAGKPAPAQTGAAPAASAGSYQQQFIDMMNKGEVSKEDRMKEITDIGKPVLDKMQAVVDENKAKLKTENEQNFFMSLMLGGAEAAAGNSPYALQNIAQGFSKGAGHFNEGLKDLRKAAQENQKMELSMEEYRASGKKDALKSYYDHQDKRQAATAAGLASIYGHQLSKEAALGAAGINAATTREYMSSMRGSQLIETTRAHIANEVEKAAEAARKAYKPMTPAEQQTMFNQKWQEALRNNPTLAQFTGQATGGGGGGGGASLRFNPATGKIE